jgi:hypothetical protein
MTFRNLGVTVKQEVLQEAKEMLRSIGYKKCRFSPSHGRISALFISHSPNFSDKV